MYSDLPKVCENLEPMLATICHYDYKKSEFEDLIKSIPRQKGHAGFQDYWPEQQRAFLKLFNSYLKADEEFCTNYMFNYMATKKEFSQIKDILVVETTVLQGIESCKIDRIQDRIDNIKWQLGIK